MTTARLDALMNIRTAMNDTKLGGSKGANPLIKMTAIKCFKVGENNLEGEPSKRFTWGTIIS